MHLASARSLLRRTSVRFTAAQRCWRPADEPSALVAVDDKSRRRVRAVLSDCRLTFVRTRAQLIGCLCTEGFGLVLIGSQFDSDGPLAVLPEAVRMQPACPVVCLATGTFEAWTRPGTYAEFRSACLERGAYDALDLARWPDDPDGNAQLRHLLESVPGIAYGAKA